MAFSEGATWLDEIDWRRLWLGPVLLAARPILQSSNWRQALNWAAAEKELRNYRSMHVHFVPQADLPFDAAYEAFISATGGEPTRDNLDDFFIALVWLSFPKFKAQLNALQVAELASKRT